jgi:ribosomal protein L37E
MKQVTFKVPDWFPTHYELDRFRRWVRYKLSPPRCPTCNTKIPKKLGSYFVGKINNQRFYVSLSPARCRKCTEEYINSLDLKTVKCASCGNTEKGTGYHSKNKNILTMMWGASWNGKEHCIDCINHAIRTGEVETGVKRWNESKQRTESVFY